MLAVATTVIFVPTVLLLDGLDIVTPANAVAAMEKKTKMAVDSRACLFIWAISPVGIWSRTGKAVQLRGMQRSGEIPSVVIERQAIPEGLSGDVSGFS